MAPCARRPGQVLSAPAGRGGRAADLRPRPESRERRERIRKSHEPPAREDRSNAARAADGVEDKKHYWYFEGLYPTFYICGSYKDACGSRCRVRALSLQWLWSFRFLLMIAVLFCCRAGFFIPPRVYRPPLIEVPAFTVPYSRKPPDPVPGICLEPPYYMDQGGPRMNPAGSPMAMAFQVQPNSPQGSTAYPPPPS